MYRNEEEDLTKKLDKHIANNAEEWDIKNTRKMLEETRKMITDVDSRLGGATQELRDIVVLGEQNPVYADDEHLVKAKETLELVSV